MAGSFTAVSATAQTTGDPVVPQGVTGRLTKDYTFTISAGNDIVIHPKQGGVSVASADVSWLARRCWNSHWTLMLIFW
jgi:hypothetical protein